MNRFTRGILFFLFFFSGFSSLVYQVVWTRLAFASFGIITPVLSVLLCMPFLSLVLALALAVAALIAWRKRYWSLRKRIQFNLTAVGALAFIPFLNYWNLLGFHY